MTLKVLVAEDAPDVAEVVSFAARMTWPGCEVVVAGNGTDAIRAFDEQPADLVVLDVSMPPPDGYEICRHIRENSNVPILMLTVRDATIDKIRAFDLGADDYLTKPFDHLELQARLRALVRRSGLPAAAPGDIFVSGDLSINFATREVYLRGEGIRFTSTEFRLLEELVRHAGVTLPHRVLLDRVWGDEWVADPSYLKVFVRRLRQKLGDDASQPSFILTDRGLGYRFVAPR